MLNIEEEVQQLEKAVHIMHIIHKTANDVLNVNRLQGFQVNSRYQTNCCILCLKIFVQSVNLTV